MWKNAGRHIVEAEKLRQCRECDELYKPLNEDDWNCEECKKEFPKRDIEEFLNGE